MKTSYDNLLRSTYCISALILVSIMQISAQIGGEHVFEFLTLANNARATALGEKFITATDGDLGGGYHNPATLSSESAGQLELGHDIYVDGIGRSSVAYGFDVDKWDSHMRIGLGYVDYGDFQETDALGNVIGNFTASDLALTVGLSHELYERLRIGGALHLAHSSYAEFNSTAAAVDLAAFYHIDDKKTALSLVFKHIGGQLSKFQDESESLPFDIQFGYTRRLEHLPFRFSIIAHHLHQWDIVFDDPDRDDNGNFGNTEETNDGFVEDFFRHLIFNGELYIGKEEQVTIRLGYNHLRARELALADFRTLAGFSTGIGLKLGQFDIGFGFGKFHAQAAASHFTLGIEPERLFGSKRTL